MQYSNRRTAPTRRKRPWPLRANARASAGRQRLREVVLDAAETFSELDHALTERPREVRKALAEDQDPDRQNDDDFRHTETKHGQILRKEGKGGNAIEGSEQRR